MKTRDSPRQQEITSHGSFGVASGDFRHPAYFAAFFLLHGLQTKAALFSFVFPPLM